ncbi:MAG: AbrB/MazE/SpoVT family DNA-binding domain-containing protein [Thermodesulfobacteriota bacterium]|nr:AbrB/MazE/SpoVT family DNA-binding domain-containing protein [Thermodesulfobacteriota bacterium]
MPIVTLSSKGQLVIPKEIREALGVKPGKKVFFKMVKDHLVEIVPLPEDPVRHFCGIFKEGSSLTKALLKEREEDKKREEKKFNRLLRTSRVSKARK